MGRDYINVERPNARMMTLKWIYLTVVRAGRPDFWPQRGAYTHNIWAAQRHERRGLLRHRHGRRNRGTEGGHEVVLRPIPARARTASSACPYDTVSKYPHYSVSSFVNWPVGMEARNPAEVLPHCYRDTVHGFVAWRNRWQDGNDVVISVLLRHTRGYHGRDADGALQINGFGRKFSWGKAAGTIGYWWQDENASATVMTTGDASTAVDFTGLSGADVLLASTAGGDGAKFAVGEAAVVPGTPFRGKAPQLIVKFLTAGEAPTPTTKDYVVTVGKRTLAVKDGNIVLGVTQ